jgi:hypothetical protein
MKVTNIEGRDFQQRDNQQAPLYVFSARCFDDTTLKYDLFANNFGVQFFLVQESGEVRVGSTQDVFPTGKTVVQMQSVGDTNAASYKATFPAENRVGLGVSQANLNADGVFVTIKVYQ